MAPSYPSTLALPLSDTTSLDKTSTAFPIHNPATGSTITSLIPASLSTVNTAVQTAEHAFQTSWRWLSPTARSTLLFQCASALEDHRTEIAEILTLENGKPYLDALNYDVLFLYSCFRYFASIFDKIPGEALDQGTTYTTTWYEPKGVTAAIIPFNWPPIHTAGKLAPALAAGNTMILKPSEQAPLTVIKIVEIINTVLPAGVVQVLPAWGPEIPQALVAHPLVRMVSFTGSTLAGTKVALTAAQKPIPVVLELGGKNALVVFDDADFERAVRTALDGAFFNKGEACTATSRLLVQRGVYDRFCAKLAEGVRKLRVGDGMDPDTHVGPQVSKAQQQNSLKYIAIAKQTAGATIAAQAPLPSNPQLKDGFFVPPTLITDVTPDMTIAQDEMFGPIVTVCAFNMEEDAIRIVNESRFGLTCCIFSRDSERCFRVARKVDVGMVFVNNYNRAVLGSPFGGNKESGYGREHCLETMRSWQNPKFIKQPTGLGALPEWRGIVDVFGQR